jgi:hypothetical protein
MKPKGFNYRKRNVENLFFNDFLEPNSGPAKPYSY